jgi:hypothetical protein
VTTDNWLTRPLPSDPQFPIARLVPWAEQTEPLPVASAPCYCGRLLFEDDRPPNLDPKPWSGARIMIDFPYAGSSEPDAEGYFQVVLTPEQFQELQNRKPSRNVYIPTHTQKGSSTARFVYPASLLAEKKDDAGVLKFPRPDGQGSGSSTR